MRFSDVEHRSGHENSQRNRDGLFETCSTLWFWVWNLGFSACDIQAANSGAASVALQCQVASFTADSVLINPSVVGGSRPALVNGLVLLVMRLTAGHALSRCSAAFVDSLRHLFARDLAWSDSQVCQL